MEPRSTITHLYVGGEIRYLLSATTTYGVHGHGHVLMAMQSLSEDLDHANLTVSKRLFEALLEPMAKKWKKEGDGQDQEWRKKRTLTSTEASELNKAASNLEQTVWAEARGQVAFITSEKRYDVNRLLDNVSGLMAANVYDELPAMAQFDFSSAGRCIAFEVPTAGAFHLMRGTEATLRHFYCSIVKRQRVDPLLWYPMTEHLKKRRKAPPDVLMQNLDNIRKSFRNPTQHPEKVYDVDEVQDLFGLSIDVVTRMVQLLR